MRHSPHCIPPDEVGDPGVCMCDGSGERCPPESRCVVCWPEGDVVIADDDGDEY